MGLVKRRLAGFVCTNQLEALRDNYPSLFMIASCNEVEAFWARLWYEAGKAFRRQLHA